MVAREGSLSAAARALRLSHPTLSTQIRALEQELGEPLFTRAGRSLALTDTGRLVYRFADEIFSLGRELVETVRGEAGARERRLQVGVTDVVPKLVVRRLLEPVLTLPEPVHIVCHEDEHDRLLAALALHTLDVVLSDAPVAPGGQIRAFHHLLGETGVSLFAEPSMAEVFREGFPGSLDRAPVLLPIEALTLRRSLDAFFARLGVRPHVVAEFADSALLKVFGADGIGIFPAPTAVEREVCAQYGVEVIGRAQGVHERFYAITAERRLSHPAVVALSDSARRTLFARPPRRGSTPPDAGR
jgi:LysR family transcriptional activator of nhaA